MTPIAIAGVLLIVLGVAALIYQAVTYTSRETIVDIGPIHATADRERTLPLPPVIGIAAVAGGVACWSQGRASACNRSSQWDRWLLWRSSPVLTSARLRLSRSWAPAPHEQHQVPLHKINVISYGEDKPVAPNTTRAGRALNRRVVVRVLS